MNTTQTLEDKALVRFYRKDLTVSFSSLIKYTRRLVSTKILSGMNLFSVEPIIRRQFYTIPFKDTL